MTTYTWSKRTYPVDAQIVGDTIAQLAEAHDGACQPAQLVTAAKPKSSPLHKLFDWDNRSAADKWRTHQARQVINAVSITVASDDGPEHLAPAFISVGHVLATQEAGEGYRSIDVVANDEAFAQEAMQDVIHRLNALKRRYRAMEALAPVWRALAELEAA